jgi:hypothetical protein
MFGGIQSRANAGSASHFAVILWSPVQEKSLIRKPIAAEEEGEAKSDDDDDNVPSQTKMEFSMNIGVQFGLTDTTSDTALKF